jgi:hypothetical protein
MHRYIVAGISYIRNAVPTASEALKETRGQTNPRLAQAVLRLILALEKYEVELTKVLGDRLWNLSKNTSLGACWEKTARWTYCTCLCHVAGLHPLGILGKKSF